MMRSQEKFFVAAASSAMSIRLRDGSKAALSHAVKWGGLEVGRVWDKDRL